MYLARCPRRAFSVIEAMVVLVVMSLLAGITVTTFARLHGEVRADAAVLAATSIRNEVDALAATRAVAPSALPMVALEGVIDEITQPVLATYGDDTVTITVGSGPTSTSACITLDALVGGRSSVERGACTTAPNPDGLAITGIDPDDAQLTVAFTDPSAPPTSSDAARVASTTTYTLTATTPGRTPRTVTRPQVAPLTVGGLINGLPYVLTLTATRATGATETVTATAVPIGVPATPVITSATGGDRSITVTWTVQPSAARPISGIHLYLNATVVATLPAEARTATLTTDDVPAGLDNGVAYDIQVGAYNARQWDSVSNAMTVVPRTTPDAPMSVTATGSNRAATVSFTAPASSGGAPITGYLVSVYDTAGAKVAAGSGPASPILVRGLTNGVTYTVRVAAANSAGVGPESEPVTVTPTTDRRPPTITATVPADASFQVGWEPADIPGATIAGYRIYVNGQFVLAAAASETTAIVTSADVPGGLTNGVRYSVQVAAHWASASGGGEALSAAASVTPARAPGAPVITAVTPGNGQLTVAFRAPTDDGGRPVTAYVVTASAGGASLTKTVAASPAVLTPLLNGTTYTVTVAAINPAGTGTASAPQTGTPTAGTSTTVPPATTISLTATPGDRSITLAWSTTGPAPDEFQIAVGTTTVATTTGNQLTLTTTDVPGGLTNGTSYTVNVNARVAGTVVATATSSVTPRTVPAAPTLDTVTPGPAQITAAFTAPTDNGGNPVASYTVIARHAGTVLTAIGGSSPITITGTTDGAAWDVTVTASNQAGAGPESNSLTAVPLSAPSRPLLTATAGDARIDLAWTAPTTAARPVSGIRIVVDGSVVAIVPADTTTYTVTGDDLTGGMVNGSTYVVQVEAYNTGGARSSEPVAVTPGLVPGAPNVTGITAGDGTLTVAVGAPEPAGTGPVLAYTATAAAPGHPTRTATAVTSPITLTALTNGVTYNVTVVAANATGTGAVSEPATGTPLGLPVVPQVAVTGADRTLTVTWTASSTPANPTDGFHIIVDGAIITTTTAPGTVTLTTTDIPGGLTNGTSYAVQVAAYNTTGSQTSAAVPAVPYTTPAAPTEVTATADDTELVVSFTSPADDGGNPITSYTATATSPGHDPVTATGTTSPLTITGLTNGVTYTVTVVATNDAGDSPASNTATGTPQARPATPAATASGADQRVDVTWTLPDDPSRPVNGFHVYIAPAPCASATPTVVATVDATDRALTITSADVPGGLTNGTSYCVWVAAYNTIGESRSSTTVATPAAAPGAPTITKITAGDAQLVVAVEADDTGGSPITGYTATATTPGQPSVTILAASSPIVVSGLTNGVTYSVTVVATNSAGTGPASAPMTGTPVAPLVVPVVAITSATAADASATVTWTTDGPADNHIVYVGGTAAATVAGTARDTVLTGLTNGVTYTVTVAAVLDGVEYASTPVTVAPYTVPAAPTVSGIVAGDTMLTVAVSAGADGGRPVTDYTATATATGRTPVTATSTSSPVVLTGLTNGVTYTVTVAATNLAGTGPGSAPLPGTPVGAPAVPVIDALTPGERSFTVTWTAVSSAAAPVTGIDIVVDGTVVHTATALTGSRTVTVEDFDIDNGTTYTVTVVARNDVDFTTSESAEVTPRGTPTEPTLTAVAAGDTSLTATFTAPASNGGAPVTSYTVTATADGQPTRTVVGAASPLTITGLTNGVTYTVTVIATNAAGDSPASNPLTATSYGAPSTPVLTATPSDGALQLTWTLDAGAGHPVDSIEVWLDGTLASTLPGSARSAALTSLTNGTTYQVAIRALNSRGSTWSAPVTATPSTPPGAPRALTATAGNQQATLTWGLPLADGGNPITDYVVEYSADGGTTWTTIADEVSTTRTITITGLTNGTVHRFRVAAVNASGTGTMSSAVSATPYTVPGAPTTLTAVAGYRKATLSWQAPTSNGGQDITDYVVAYSADNGTTWTAFDDGAGTATGTVVTGLIDVTTYLFRVAAVNLAGSGPWSDTATMTTVLVADAPTNLTGTAGNTRVDLTWSAPADTGGQTITDYRVERSTDGASWTVVSRAPSTTPAQAVTSLTNGTAYTFRVAAITAAGVGLYTTAGPYTPVTVPNPVTSLLAASTTTSSVALTWNAPTVTGGTPVTDYVITYSLDNATWTTFDDGVSATTGATVTGLGAGFTYWFQVVAVNAAGSSTATSRSATTNTLAAQQTFSYTGTAQSWTVPDGVTSVTVDVYGAQGGGAYRATWGGNVFYPDLAGGLGGRTQATITVTPGETLWFYVGGKGAGPSSSTTASSMVGGWNGGGDGGLSNGNYRGGAGGGASDVRRGGTTLANRVVVAGGGGGAAHAEESSGKTLPLGGPGNGGALTGATGYAGTWSAATYPATGGTQAAGGTRSTSTPSTSYCLTNNTAGSLGTGGRGADRKTVGTVTSGGGAGGGYFGGAGGVCATPNYGRAGTGGGGSNYVTPDASFSAMSAGARSGDGVITVSY